MMEHGEILKILFIDPIIIFRPKISLILHFDQVNGNIGFGVFKGGIQNQKVFWLKINCSEIKSLDLQICVLCNGEVSKSAEI